VKTVFRNGEVGYGSAMAVVLTAIVLGVGLVYSRLSRQRAARSSEEPAPVVAAGQAVVERLVVPEQAG
jgi:formate-dependent nitrite reductase membrane component NrfD